MHPVQLLDLVLLAMAAAVVLALAARRLDIPPAVAFLPGGMLLAVAPGVPAFELDPALSMTLFLPPLLQSSAFFTVWRDFRANIRAILLLAVGAVGFTTAVVGVVMKWLEPSLPWAACFTLGAIISPPDAVAAGAVLERLRIPRRLLTVLEGESLVNDASGLVLYRFAIAVALGGAFDAWSAAATFAVVAAGGVAIGLACGWLLVRIVRAVSEINLQITASFLGAYASYIAAEAVDVSGVLSTVACGLVLGWAQHGSFSPETRQQSLAAWGFVVFVLEALVFILIGLSLRGVLPRLGGDEGLWLLGIAVVVTVVVIAARFAWVFPIFYLSRVAEGLLTQQAERRPMPAPRIPFIVSWAGMRGVVSLAAALALPENFPGRDPILLVTFVVILSTVLIQGPTLGPLIRWLRVTSDAMEGDGELSEHAVRAALTAEQLRFVEERAADPLDGAMAADMLPEFRDRALMASNASRGGAARALRDFRLRLYLEAMAAARTELLRLHARSQIHDTTLRRIEHDLDLEEIGLRLRLKGGG